MIEELLNLVIEKGQIVNNNQDSNPIEYIEPNSYDQAWNHKDPIQRHKWYEAIMEEFQDMGTRKVWKKMNRSNMPHNRQCGKSKWIL